MKRKERRSIQETQLGGIPERSEKIKSEKIIRELSRTKGHLSRLRGLIKMPRRMKKEILYQDISW